MFELVSKKKTKKAPLTPKDRLDWLMDFIEIQGQINPNPKKSEGGFELKKKDA
jgi:hypothetical protein